jgi:DNA-binding CsgD family transcriptional regulator
VLILSAYDDYAYVIGALEAGVAGYLLKTASARELGDAVRTTAGGALGLDEAISRRLTRPWRSGPGSASVALTARETEVLRLLVQGPPNKQIASQLGLGLRTVESHVSSVLGKLELTSRTEAALYAVSHRLGDTSPHPAGARGRHRRARRRPARASFCRASAESPGGRAQADRAGTARRAAPASRAPGPLPGAARDHTAEPGHPGRRPRGSAPPDAGYRFPSQGRRRRPAATRPRTARARRCFAGIPRRRRGSGHHPRGHTNHRHRAAAPSRDRARGVPDRSGSRQNVIRHAGASRLLVTLAFGDGWLCLRVADDSGGFDPTALDRQGQSQFLRKSGQARPSRHQLLGAQNAQSGRSASWSASSRRPRRTAAR